MLRLPIALVASLVVAPFFLFALTFYARHFLLDWRCPILVDGPRASSVSCFLYSSPPLDPLGDLVGSTAECSQSRFAMCGAFDPLWRHNWLASAFSGTPGGHAGAAASSTGTHTRITLGRRTVVCFWIPIWLCWLQAVVIAWNGLDHLASCSRTRSPPMLLARPRATASAVHPPDFGGGRPQRTRYAPTEFERSDGFEQSSSKPPLSPEPSASSGACKRS